MLRKRWPATYIKGLYFLLLFVFAYFLKEILHKEPTRTSFSHKIWRRVDDPRRRCDVNGCARSRNDVMHLVVVTCQGKSESIITETLNMIKSATLFTKRRLHVHVFTVNLEETLQREFTSWPHAVRATFDVTIHPLRYPLPPNEVEVMMDWWGPCASFRLFLPTVMTDVDAILYVDTDVIFMGPVDELWAHFYNFNSDQVGGLAPRVGWDFKVPPDNPNFIVQPDGKMTQVNSGVFLMNLTRMRMPVFRSHLPGPPLSWQRDLLLPVYRDRIKDMIGDQNLINTIFHHNPERLYLLPCRYNYHHKFCFDRYRGRLCPSAEVEGAHVIHGNANTYYNNYAPAFRIVYDVISQYNFEDDLEKFLVQPMAAQLKDPAIEGHAHCGNKSNLFLKTLTRSVSLINEVE